MPAIYIGGASVVLVILCAYRPSTTWPVLIIVMIGAAVYAILRKRRGPAPSPGPSAQA